ncbi:MAG: DnaJ domain-containing protein [Roseiflexaceae bacterium]
MNDLDYYTILGVARSAGIDDIKHAYRRLARQYHPDLHPGDASAEAKMKMLNLAIDILADREKRVAYDRATHEYTAQAAVDTPVGVVQHAFAAYGRRDGHDVDYPITISSVEARIGTRRDAQFHNSDGQPYTVAIVVPPGVTAGMRLRLAGMGGPGINGGRRGDLYAVIAISEGEDRFKNRPPLI